MLFSHRQSWQEARVLEGLRKEPFSPNGFLVEEAVVPQWVDLGGERESPLLLSSTHGGIGKRVWESLTDKI